MAVRFAVRLTPRGGADRVEGVGPDGLLRCRLRAAPVDGAANEALVRLVAEVLGVPRTAVAIEGGASARTKRLRIDGVGGDELAARWPGLALR